MIIIQMIEHMEQLVAVRAKAHDWISISNFGKQSCLTNHQQWHLLSKKALPLMQRLLAIAPLAAH